MDMVSCLPKIQILNIIHANCLSVVRHLDENSAFYVEGGKCIQRLCKLRLLKS